MSDNAKGKTAADETNCSRPGCGDVCTWCNGTRRLAFGIECPGCDEGGRMRCDVCRDEEAETGGDGDEA
jgi:hypothetical protein